MHSHTHSHSHSHSHTHTLPLFCGVSGRVALLASFHSRPLGRTYLPVAHGPRTLSSRDARNAACSVLRISINKIIRKRDRIRETSYCIGSNTRSSIVPTYRRLPYNSYCGSGSLVFLLLVRQRFPNNLLLSNEESPTIGNVLAKFPWGFWTVSWIYAWWRGYASCHRGRFSPSLTTHGSVWRISIKGIFKEIGSGDFLSLAYTSHGN